MVRLNASQRSLEFRLDAASNMESLTGITDQGEGRVKMVILVRLIWQTVMEYLPCQALC